MFRKNKNFLEKEGMTLNKKTRIYKNTNSFVFLGRTNKDKYAKYRQMKRKIKKRYYLYKSGSMTLNAMMSVIRNFKSLNKKNI